MLGDLGFEPYGSGFLRVPVKGAAPDHGRCLLTPDMWRCGMKTDSVLESASDPHECSRTSRGVG